MLFRGRDRRLRRQLADLADLQPGHRVLDVGSGTGTLAVALAEVVGRDGSVTGVDPSPAMVAAARAKAGRRAHPARFLVAAAQQLPFPDRGFDAVLTTLALHHVPEDRRSTAVAEMLRVLRPGGHLLIADLQPPSGLADRLVARSRFRHMVGPAYLDELAELVRTAGAVEAHRHSTAISWLGLVHARRSDTP